MSYFLIFFCRESFFKFLEIVFDLIAEELVLVGNDTVLMEDSKVVGWV